ncbi:3-carboxy-cis,cis-muconate cycloisomerase [Piscinibacter sp.]|uniref:3-carboxy-cis,cis-muconate cycloisomerase n=1 Tax=Piscinibacter sp. TaxID=1903157 RepID=UPI002C3D514E|nr:3-carboxy-cis,cis-muconate cycloisomerase [Albitalea sp.]HUG26407.1 3-carboxy-cis,cis-muconate cycloisomerase [Albitalea sp.]
MSALVFESLLSTPEMIEVFSETAVVQAMLDFEAALARAQSDEGVIPPTAGPAIVGVCKSELYDLRSLVGASARAGSLAIPLVKKLTETVALFDADAAGYVHWGSASQDAVDTAMVLCLRRALALLDRDLTTLTAALLTLAQRHREAPVLGRTLMQPAQVLSVDFKLAGWIAPLVRSQQRLRAAGAAALRLQLGGAVGTLAAMGEKAPAVVQRVAQSLQIATAPAAWHTQRDELVSLACEVGVLTGTLGKIAKDVSLMAQGEIGEMSEPSGGGGRGGSSAMPHKRNPVAAMIALAASLRVPHRVSALLAAMAQEHERGLGNWQAELAEVAGLFIAAHGAVKALADVAGGLQVDTPRMRRNIDGQQGLVFAEAVAILFARRIGKARAHGLLEQLSQQAVASGRHLRELTLEACASDDTLRGHFSADDVAGLFDADGAARHASALAAPQLESLAQTAASLAQRPPWAAWLETKEV